MIVGKRRTFLYFVSCFLILMVIVTLRGGNHHGGPRTSPRSRTRDAKRSADAHAKNAPNPYKYKVFDNYNEANEEYDAYKDQGPNGDSTDPLDIRTFSSTDDQLLYLYNKVLSAPWMPNRKNLASFRDVFYRQTRNMTAQDEVILNHQNVKLGDSLPYAFTNTLGAKDGVKYYFNITQEILDEIPVASPFHGKTFKRCSVVGNSGILWNSKCGKDIDKADFVFRSNVPPLRPFVVDAGRKSNLSTMNPSIINNRFRRLKDIADHEKFAKEIGEYNGMLWLPCIGSVKMVEVCLQAKRSLDFHGGGNPRTAIANPYHYIAVQYFWSHRNLTQFMSTGFYVTHLSLAMCDETHLYGFWPFGTTVEDSPTDPDNNTVSFRQRKVRYHYFDNLPGPNGAHSMQDEFGVLVQMHKLGMLKMHASSCQE
ncbi:CMP-N-acetylneuraminate-poly-alpha-2,8-sialyltransferase-like [Patiria miniata]|uniref:Uncharacterized protein n=1 Tax=Patiria miniata TaxID=46514 RepID=A0A914AUY8_PATMI|nr:CMP-N-acetylneuraminate-poly-alpha-2,8-sialyltransferase-like [Patiria miniata]XP_038067130.1 CMP-N-acetylneuraminate-poly-alpha-2,8-sialyltransferase-like [Patiria miniata]